jgi:hypothetical protein
MITSSAIQIIHTGKSHAEIILRIIREPEMLPTFTTEGFVNDKGNFLNRKEAAVHAYECGQINELLKELFSSDLEGI